MVFMDWAEGLKGLILALYYKGDEPFCPDNVIAYVSRCSRSLRQDNPERRTRFCGSVQYNAPAVGDNDFSGDG